MSTRAKIMVFVHLGKVPVKDKAYKIAEIDSDDAVLLKSIFYVLMFYLGHNSIMTIICL